MAARCQEPLAGVAVPARRRAPGSSTAAAILPSGAEAGPEDEALRVAVEDGVEEFPEPPAQLGPWLGGGPVDERLALAIDRHLPLGREATEERHHGGVGHRASAQRDVLGADLRNRPVAEAP